MNLIEHPGPKGQIITAGRIDPFWFTSVRDTVAFTLMPDQPRDIRAIYVSDMARAPSWEDPGATNWIDARKAFFVIESRKQGGMGAAEAVPFGNRDAADAFAAANGGRVVTFAEIPKRLRAGQRHGRRPDANRLRRASQLTRTADAQPKSHAPTHDRHCCDRSRIGISDRCAEPPRPAMPCAGTDRHSARRSRSRSITRTGPRPNGWSSAVSWTCGGWSSSSVCTGPNSAISTLNRTGILVSPDADMVALLKAVAALCRDHRWRVRSDGAAAVAALCGSFLVREARSATGRRRRSWPKRWRRWATRPAVSEDRIALARHGAAITLNGIAQGYATDRVVETAAQGGPVDDAGQYGRDTGDRSEARGHAVACRSRRSRRGRACSPKPSTSSIVRSRHRRAPDSGSTPPAGLRICSIQRRDAARRATAR